jgi:hypothetical protein
MRSSAVAALAIAAALGVSCTEQSDPVAGATTTTTAAVTDVPVSRGGAAGGDDEADVCSVLDDETVGGMLEAGGRQSGAQFGARYCLWENETERLALTVGGAGYFEQVRRGTAESGSVEPVAGLGDEAFFLDAFNYAGGGGTAGRSILVRSGDRTVVVAVRPADKDADDPSGGQLRNLADEVLRRLGP